jgi:hypothetical protein
MEKKKTSSKKPSTSKKTNVKKAAPKKAVKKAPAAKKAPAKRVVKSSKLAEKNANTGLLLGIAALTSLIIPGLGLLITVLGIYCGCSGLTSKKIKFTTIALALCVFFLQIAIWNTMSYGLLG